MKLLIKRHFYDRNQRNKEASHLDEGMNLLISGASPEKGVAKIFEHEQSAFCYEKSPIIVLWGICAIRYT